MKIVEISHHGQLYLGERHTKSLKLFGKPILTREMLIVGNWGGGQC